MKLYHGSSFIGNLQMNRELTQENLYLLLPGKVLAVAEMYARHHDVTLMDAMRKVYASDMYKQLEVERTKYWHLGPVALYQTMEGVGN